MSEDARLWKAIGEQRRRPAELEAVEYAGHALSAGNADTVDTLHASAVAAAHTLLALDAASKLPASITGDADTVDSLHAATSGANAHLLATDASGSARIDGDLLLHGQLLQDDRCSRMLISRAVTDAVAAGILTITTPSAGTVSGYWSLKLHVLAYAKLTGGANLTARGNLVQLVHQNKSDGTPYTTAVEVAETDSVTSWLAGRNISALTITTTHTSNTVTTVQATVTVDGSLGSDLPGVLAMAELLWSNYSPAPVMAVA